eukprot:COSAG06_NODE_361_length_16829_cov_8.781112_14_plen_568_part_00
MLRQWVLAAVVAAATGRAATAGTATVPPAAAAAATTQAGSVWVDCSLGDDSNVGTAAAPFKSLVKARDALRGARATSSDLAAVPATVNVVGRICRSYDQAGRGQPQNASLTLDGRDSHTTWRATTTSGSHSAEAVLSGGLAINASELHAVSGAEATWFKQSAVRQIWKLSLERVDDAGRLKDLSYTGADACIRSDYFEPAGLELISVPAVASGQDPKKMVLARYPNLVEPPVPKNWADFSDPDNTIMAMTMNLTASQVSQWTKQASAAAAGGGGGAPQMWSHGLWSQDWADSHRQVLSVRPTGSTRSTSLARIALQRHDDKTDRDCNLTASSPGQQGGHVYLYNVLWELDLPGEYVIDHASKTAFLIPHTPAATHEATVATSLLAVDDAANITFDGLSFRGARGAGVVIRNSTGIVISNGGITDCGMSAFNVTGGSDCGLLNVDVVRCGTGGAVLEGGDRHTLTEANHFVRESRLRDSNRWVMNYAPLVLMAGVGQRVEGSVLSDAPQTAVFVQGNSHKLLNSTIRDVVQQCDDVRHFLPRLCSSCLLSFLLTVLYLPIMPCLPACL